MRIGPRGNPETRREVSTHTGHLGDGVSYNNMSHLVFPRSGRAFPFVRSSSLEVFGSISETSTKSYAPLNCLLKSLPSLLQTKSFNETDDTPLPKESHQRPTSHCSHLSLSGDSSEIVATSALLLLNLCSHPHRLLSVFVRSNPTQDFHLNCFEPRLTFILHSPYFTKFFM